MHPESMSGQLAGGDHAVEEDIGRKPDDEVVELVAGGVARRAQHEIVVGVLVGDFVRSGRRRVRASRGIEGASPVLSVRDRSRRGGPWRAPSRTRGPRKPSMNRPGPGKIRSPCWHSLRQRDSGSDWPRHLHGRGQDRPTEAAPLRLRMHPPPGFRIHRRRCPDRADRVFPRPSPCGWRRIPARPRRCPRVAFAFPGSSGDPFAPRAGPAGRRSARPR